MLPKYEIFIKADNASFPVWTIEWDEEYKDSIFIAYGKPFEPKTFVRLYENSKDYILKQIRSKSKCPILNKQNQLT